MQVGVRVSAIILVKSVSTFIVSDSGTGRWLAMTFIVGRSSEVAIRNVNATTLTRVQASVNLVPSSGQTVDSSDRSMLPITRYRSSVFSIS